MARMLQSDQATAFDVHDRVLRLRELAESDPVAARDRASGWIRGLSRPDRRPAGDVRRGLELVFRAGTAERIAGLAEVTILPTVHRVLRPAAFAVLDRWSPLLAKDFSEDGTGVNVVGPVVGAPLSVALGGARHLHGCSTMPFATRIEASVTDPDLRVLALDHGVLARRAGMLLGRVRDEVTTVVSGVYLLKGYLRLPGGHWQAGPMFELLRTAG